MERLADGGPTFFLAQVNNHPGKINQAPTQCLKNLVDPWPVAPVSKLQRYRADDILGFFAVGIATHSRIKSTYAANIQNPLLHRPHDLILLIYRQVATRTDLNLSIIRFNIGEKFYPGADAPIKEEYANK